MTDLVGIESGVQLGGYRVDALIGRGGMGEVYRAYDKRLERNVALKILAPRYAEDAAFRQRLLRESRLAAGIDHPNVIPVYDAGEADGRLYLAMRFVDGIDLRALLRREGPLAPERALAIAAQIADALDAAHERGLVHRDVKPSNVLLDQQRGREHAYLADFGLMQSTSDRTVSEGQLMGTVDYVAPEQIRGDDVDGRADVYALGCLLFETLTGSLPFEGASDVAVVFAHLEQEPPRATERDPALRPAVDEVLARAMAKARDERQDTCRQLVDETRVALGLTPPQPSRRVLALGVTALVGVVAAIAPAVLLLARGGGAPPAAQGSIVRIDPATSKVSAAYRVSPHPGAVAASRDRVWMGDFRDGSLWSLDPVSGAVERFTTTGEPRDLAAFGDKIYVATDGDNPLDGRVTRYDAETGNRETGVAVQACSIAGDAGAVWAAGCPFIYRLSTGSGKIRILETRRIPFQQPRSAETHRWAMRDMAIGEGALWIVGDPVDRRVFKVDAASGRIVGTTRVPFAPRSIAVGEGGVWVTGSIDDVVGRIDPDTGRLSDTIAVPRGASGVAAGFGAVWVASALDHSVSRIDPRTDEVVDTTPVSGSPREVAVGAGGVWVTADDD
jgi:DNA-binding beta-propeller fold protein YncE